MSNQRKEPTFSAVLEPNEASQDKRKPSPQQTRSSTPQAKKPVAKRPQVIIKRESSGFLWFTFILLLLLAAAGGYAGWMLFQAQSIINDQQGRIDQLEQQLTLSDDESSQSLTALTANVRTLSNDVKLALTEVDKLWGTRNVNKKAINDNQAAFTKTAEDAQKQLSSLNLKLDGLSSSLGEMTTQADTQSSSLSKLTKEMSGQEILIQSLRERVGNHVATVEGLASTVEANRKAASKIKTVEGKVKNNEEAIKAIDAFRRTVSRDLVLLKQRTGAAPQ